MSDNPTTLHNARSLEVKYGFGEVKSGAEAADFKSAMREAGLEDGSACVLTAWAGGAPADKSWINPSGWFDKRETAEDACGRDFPDVPDVEDALEELRSASPALAQLVEVKAGRKQRSEYRSLVENANQDAVKLGKDAIVKVKEVLKDTADTAGDVLDAALPWKLVIAIVVVLIAIGAVWVLAKK
ncbi:MAG: hypothetical protein H6747_08945 [Deltaproteobacteria bacterium]|nr:hypothetical protein [Deltaproteobacteria bacterium]